MCKALYAINSKNYERFLSEIELYSGRSLYDRDFEERTFIKFCKCHQLIMNKANAIVNPS